MNYENGRATGMTVAEGSGKNRFPHDSRHNAIFETYEEFSKIWKKYEETGIGHKEGREDV